MKLNRLAVVTALSLFAAGMSRADLVDVNINLNDIPTFDGGSWGAGQSFSVQTNPDVSTDGYFQDGICTQSGDGTPFVSSYDIDGVDCGLSDASIRVNQAGDAPGFPGTITTDEDGGGVFGPFDADGVNSLLFSTSYSKDDPIFDNGDFQCSSDYYTFCGFQISDPQNMEAVYILLANPIPSPVPEPSYGLVFFGASGLLIWARKTRRSKQV